MKKHEQYEELLTPAEVARIFRVDPKTVTRWADNGDLEVVRTIGGQRRYPKAGVMEKLEASRRGGRSE